jgi:transposase InsO family protein
MLVGLHKTYRYTSTIPEVMQNGFVESFNGRLRGECLNAHVFTNLKEARLIIGEWRIDYNTNRPHSAHTN